MTTLSRTNSTGTPKFPSTSIPISAIEFHPLSATEWRVSDRRFPRHSIEALLGFVARKGDHYYVTRMHHPREATPLLSLDLVAAFFAGNTEN